jgi:hypothetical protein
MADRVRFPAAAAAALAAVVTACAPVYGPAPPGRVTSLPPDNGVFRASDFAWSMTPGHNALAGTLGHPGPGRYTCAGATVVLTPETSWARRRMTVLYKSDQRASLPADDVRSRQSQAPPGDSNPYLKRALCDAQDHFNFANLPDGAWYAVTIAKPIPAGSGPNLAVMRRVTTRGGRVTAFEF